MQRYAGELTPADNRPAIPMMFDGWDYVPLEPAALVASKDLRPGQDAAEERALAVDSAPEQPVTR